MSPRVTARLLERFEGTLHIETKSSEADLVTEEGLGNRTVIAVLEAAGVSAASADQRMWRP